MRSIAGLRSDPRGQSVALEYTLGLAVAFLLITGLLVAGGDYITDQRDRAQQSELRVIGQQLAADIEAADRLAVASTDGGVRIERALPSAVARSGYTVNVTAEENPELLLSSQDAPVEVEVDLTNQTAVAPTKFNGGFVVVEYTAGGEIEVERGDRYA